MTDSILSIFDSDPRLGEELMSLTPPHEMEDSQLLFPDLLDVIKDSDPIMPISKAKDDSKVICIKLNPGQESELEEYLSGKWRTGSGKLQTEPISKPETVRPSVSNSLSATSTTPHSVPGKTLPTGRDLDIKGISDDEEEYPPSPTSSVSESIRSYVSGCQELHQSNKCMTKSAVAARENRQRKKDYVDSLERSVHTLSRENKTLNTSVTGLSNTVTSLRTEVQYLKSVLANQSTLATLLKNIPGTPGIRLKSSELVFEGHETDQELDDSLQKENVCNESSNKVSTRANLRRKAQSVDHDYATHNAQKKIKSDPGVCLHVSSGEVSLEFCATCSNRAAQGRS